jgi:cytochrome c
VSFKSCWRGGAAVALFALMSCGGGGGGGAGSADGTASPPGQAVASVPGEYLGTFVGACEAADPVVLAVSGNPLTVRSYLTVGPATGNVARLSLRFDFHEDASCATNPVAYLSFDNTSNQATFAGPQVVDGRTVQRVRTFFAPPSGTTSAGNGRIEFGDAFRVSAPADLGRAFGLDDLWFVDGNTLYEGDLSIGPGGFPTALDMTSSSQRVTSPPPMLAACPARSVSWGPDNCEGGLPARVSGASILLADVTGPSLGNATFTCTAGNWARSNPTCAMASSPPAPGSCATQPVSWTVNGLTCEGVTRSMPDGATDLIFNTSAPNHGAAQFLCTGGTPVLSVGSCDPPAPPAPVLTDPAQIAQAKNCIACHAVSDPAQSVNGVSFQVIADHYRGSPPAAGVLENRVKFGSVGTFGAVPMNANPQISDAELAIVIPWILNR